jgi:hypothetical protein
LDDVDIVEGIDLAVDVDHVFVFKAAHYLDDEVGIADVGKELIAQAFAFGGALDEPCDVDKGDGGGNGLETFGEGG